MNKCSICKKEVDSESAPILTMGAYGNPRLLCDECSGELDIATTDTEITRIAEAMDKISAKMGANEPEDVVIDTVTSILTSAAVRAKSIKEGSYDFSLDGKSDGFDEIPEELLETEEDKEIEKLTEEKNQKFDKIFNIISTVIFSAVGIYIVYRLLDLFLF